MPKASGIDRFGLPRTNCAAPASLAPRGPAHRAPGTEQAAGGMQWPCPGLVQPYPELTRHGANPEVTRAETGKATLDQPLVTFRAPLLTVPGEASPFRDGH